MEHELDARIAELTKRPEYMDDKRPGHSDLVNQVRQLYRQRYPEPKEEPRVLGVHRDNPEPPPRPPYLGGIVKGVNAQGTLLNAQDALVRMDDKVGGFMVPFVEETFLGDDSAFIQTLADLGHGKRLSISKTDANRLVAYIEERPEYRQHRNPQFKRELVQLVYCLREHGIGIDPNPKEVL